MTTLEILGNLLCAAVGVALFVALVLGEPLKARSRRSSLVFGASIFVSSLAMLVNRILENPPGIWWWLGVGGMAAAVIGSVVWLFLAARKGEELPPQGLRFRPAALLLLLLGDAALLAAFRAQTLAAQVLLVLLACLVLFAFTQLVWVKPQTT